MNSLSASSSVDCTVEPFLVQYSLDGFAGTVQCIMFNSGRNAYANTALDVLEISQTVAQEEGSGRSADECMPHYVRDA